MGLTQVLFNRQELLNELCRIETSYIHEITEEKQERARAILSSLYPPKIDPWLTEWPTEDGFYWFYGRIKDREYSLYQVKVRHAGPADKRFIIYIINGAFMYKSEGWNGFWHPNNPPLLPKVEQ